MDIDFLTRLRSEVLILYAPMHTLLTEWGKPLETHLSEWILNHPEAYQEALTKSYAAGCDMGHTATQASSVFRAKTFKLEGRVREFNYQSAKLAREVTPKDRFVVGNISASNPDFLEPVGSYTRDFMIGGYTEQIMTLAEAGVDVFHIGGNQIDALCLAVTIAKGRTGLPVIAANHIYRDAKGFHTLYGPAPAAASRRVTEAGADVVGCLCGLFSYEDATSIVGQMRKGTNSILGVQPDAGMPELVDGTTTYSATPQQMAARVGDWINAGARLVGGCCGTTLEHYTQLSSKLKEIKRHAA